MGVSAPSSFTSAQANGRSVGWPSLGVWFHVHVVTVPWSPTSTSSSMPWEVTGSYSCGGTSTRPSSAFTPSTRPAFSPARNAPRTGPVERVYGNSRTCGASRTPVDCAMALPLHCS